MRSVFCVVLVCGALCAGVLAGEAEPAAKSGDAAKAEENPLFAKPSSDLPGLKNFAKVSDILYRGQQPTAEGMAELKKLGIKTVINLRSMHSDRDELKGLGLQYVHINCKAWHPEDEDVAKFLKVLRDPANHPVFVHCQHGADRTGMMVAVYRITHQGWDNETAAKELKNFGFHTIWTDIVKYLKKFDAARLEKRIETEKVKIDVVK